MNFGPRRHRTGGDARRSPAEPDIGQPCGSRPGTRPTVSPALIHSNSGANHDDLTVDGVDFTPNICPYRIAARPRRRLQPLRHGPRR